MSTKAYSTDLRSRVVDEVAAGSSRRQAAARFRVSVSSAIRWVALRKEKGGVEPRPRGGKSRSPLSAHTAWLLALGAAEPDLTLAATVDRLRREREVKTSEGSIRRFYKRHRISFKKNAARRRAGSGGRRRSTHGVEGQPEPT